MHFSGARVAADSAWMLPTPVVRSCNSVLPKEGVPLAGVPRGARGSGLERRKPSPSDDSEIAYEAVSKRSSA